MSLFRCPICSAALERGEKRYLCPKGHSYDLAREGYVNLLPANRKHAKDPGDDREMVAARGRFLEGGWYAPLRETLCRLTAQARPQALLDCGCGEGYYTAGVCAALREQTPDLQAAGVDLSRHALKRAARRDRGGEFAVASVYHLPLGEGSVDLLLNCFSPLALEEFRRVLRPGGGFLYVVPGARHLWELKEVLYERPYENQEQAIPYEGFTYRDIVPVEFSMALPAPALGDLFAMTPYCWKTPKAGVERLRALTHLDVTASFRVHVFRRT